jgi:hypothetical protein
MSVKMKGKGKGGGKKTKTLASATPCEATPFATDLTFSFSGAILKKKLWMLFRIVFQAVFDYEDEASIRLPSFGFVFGSSSLYPPQISAF